jgi:hypothetical protein
MGWRWPPEFSLYSATTKSRSGLRLAAEERREAAAVEAGGMREGNR